MFQFLANRTITVHFTELQKTQIINLNPVTSPYDSPCYRIGQPSLPYHRKPARRNL
jgi:hypothetical protein